MKVKFIANPYHYLSYCLIPEYPITIYTQKAGVQFDHMGYFVTEDAQLIAGIRAYINAHRLSSQIAEYNEEQEKAKELEKVKEQEKAKRRKKVDYEPIVRETVKPVETYEQAEARQKLVALLRL